MARKLLAGIAAYTIATYLGLGILSAYQLATPAGESGSETLVLLVIAPISFPLIALFILQGLLAWPPNRDGIVGVIALVISILTFVYLYRRWSR